VVDEPEAPLPRRAAMELRAPALWVDVEIEVPFVHATVGMEAFGLSFDDPDEALRTGRGDRTPFGLDLEWESDHAKPEVEEHSGSLGYSLLAQVTGEVLIGPERHELHCPGRRWHRWGARPWWDATRSGAGSSHVWVGAHVPFSGFEDLLVQAALDDRGWTLARRSRPATGEMGPA
jgi:hypothetical protein